MLKKFCYNGTLWRAASVPQMKMTLQWWGQLDDMEPRDNIIGYTTSMSPVTAFRRKARKRLGLPLITWLSPTGLKGADNRRRQRNQWCRSKLLPFPWPIMSPYSNSPLSPQLLEWKWRFLCFLHQISRTDFLKSQKDKHQLSIKMKDKHH